jgi:hypothetical protein
VGYSPVGHSHIIILLSGSLYLQTNGGPVTVPSVELASPALLLSPRMVKNINRFMDRVCSLLLLLLP